MSIRDTLKKSRAKVYPVEISTGTVYVKSMTGSTRQRYAELSKAMDGTIPIHTIAALGLCEQNGDMAYPMDTDKDIAVANAELKDVDGADIEKVCLKLFEVSGLGKDAREQAEKKSEASQNA